MTKPREILLNRHRAADEKLDDIRQAVVRKLHDEEAKQPRAALVTWLLGCSRMLWSELIWPSRKVWAGLAAVWVISVAVMFATREDRPVARRSGPEWSPQSIMALRLQEPSFADWKSEETMPVPRHSPAPPGPRSQQTFRGASV